MNYQEEEMLRELKNIIWESCDTEPGQTNTVLIYLFKNNLISVKSSESTKGSYWSLNRFLAQMNYDATYRVCTSHKQCAKRLAAIYCISPESVVADRKKVLKGE